MFSFLPDIRQTNQPCPLETEPSTASSPRTTCSTIADGLHRKLGNPQSMSSSSKPNSPAPFFPRRRQIMIANDSAECGRLAARFYLTRSFRHLAYVHMLLSRRWSNERAQAFQKEASNAGATCAVYLPPNDTDTDWSVECCRLGAWLRALPKPCGILAANDNRAIQVIQICHDLDITIPDQISVLGVDDDDILCDTCRPRLSSISPDFQTGGYMAAQALDEMLTTGKKPSDRLSYGEPAIIERESTYDPKGTTRIVSCARDFIRQHHQDNIGTKDIATAVGVSSRTLERRFIASTGLSPLASLTKARLEHARNLLLSSSTPIGEIFKIVGFGSPSRLAVAFKQEYGKTMRHMRQEDSAPQSQRPRF